MQTCKVPGMGRMCLREWEDPSNSCLLSLRPYSRPLFSFLHLILTSSLEWFLIFYFTEEEVAVQWAWLINSLLIKIKVGIWTTFWFQFLWCQVLGWFLCVDLCGLSIWEAYIQAMGTDKSNKWPYFLFGWKQSSKLWLDNGNKKLPGKGAKEEWVEEKENIIKWRENGIQCGQILEKLQKECLRKTLLGRMAYTLKYSQGLNHLANSYWAVRPGVGCRHEAEAEAPLEAVSREGDT